MYEVINLDLILLSKYLLHINNQCHTNIRSYCLRIVLVTLSASCIINLLVRRTNVFILNPRYNNYSRKKMFISLKKNLLNSSVYFS